MHIELAPNKYQDPLADEHLPIIQDNQVRLAIHQLCATPFGEEIIACDKTNDINTLQSPYVEPKTMHEQSMNNESNHLLANTSTIGGDYLVLPVHATTPLPSITFDHLQDYNSTSIISNMNFIHATSNIASQNEFADNQGTELFDSLSSSSSPSATDTDLDWTNTGFNIHRLRESPQDRIDHINKEVQTSVVKGRYVRTVI